MKKKTIKKKPSTRQILKAHIDEGDLLYQLITLVTLHKTLGCPKSAIIDLVKDVYNYKEK